MLFVVGPSFRGFIQPLIAVNQIVTRFLAMKTLSRRFTSGLSGCFSLHFFSFLLERSLRCLETF